MKARTCPKCGYTYSPSEFYRKFFFKPVWYEWNCDNCGTKLTFSKSTRIILALIKVFWLYVLFLLKDIYKGNWLWYIFLIFLLIVGFMLISLFNRFVEVKKEKNLNT